MYPLRVIRPGVLLTGLLAVAAITLGAGEDGFNASLTPAEQDAMSVSPGLDELNRVEDESGSVSRPQPRERPRLKHGNLLSESGRLRVHGGMSFTVGGGSGGSFHGASTWVSYHDPVTGISLGFAFSHRSGNGYHGTYPAYGYSPHFSSDPVSYYSSLPHVQPSGSARAETPSFIRTGINGPNAGPPDLLDAGRIGHR